MAFAGYHIKLGNTIVPDSYIKFDSWNCTYETLDVDSFRDSTGLLHRNALASRKVKAEFETPNMYASEMAELLTIIRSNYVSQVEQSVNATVWVDELQDYVTQLCYIPNITFKVAQNSPQGLIYAPTRIAFIGY